jgi:cytochrome aa3-600 menaquinol oxidase subunit 4
MNQHSKGFPATQIYGFIASLVLTFAALFIALKTSLSVTAIMYIIGTLAFIQAGMQLFMFMHLKDGEEDGAKAVNIYYAIFLALVTVFGSMWVMSFSM